MSDWYAFFYTCYLSSGDRERNEIWHKGSLWCEDDARTSNTRILDDEKYDVRHRDQGHPIGKNNIARRCRDGVL